MKLPISVIRLPDGSEVELTPDQVRDIHRQISAILDCFVGTAEYAVAEIQRQEQAMYARLQMEIAEGLHRRIEQVGLPPARNGATMPMEATE
jgi:hypothetical protein